MALPPLPDLTGQRPSDLTLQVAEPIREMLQTMSTLARRKPVASQLAREVMERLRTWRDLDPKSSERISHALAVLRGEDEESARSPNGPNGKHFE